MQNIQTCLSGLFDAVFFVASFHHLTDILSRESVLQQAKECLSEEGSIYMTNWYLHGLENQEKYGPSVTKKYPDGSNDYTITLG